MAGLAVTCLSTCFSALYDKSTESETEVEDIKSSRKCVGIKQSKEAVARGLAKKAFVACDVDAHIKDSFLELCKEMNVSVEFYESKHELGKACGIDVGAACAVIL